MNTSQDKFAELMKELFGLEPLTIYKEPTNKIDMAQNQAMAECYAKEGFRKYMENAINLTMKSAVMNRGDEFARGVRAGRITSLKELLSASARAFKKYPKK